MLDLITNIHRLLLKKNLIKFLIKLAKKINPDTKLSTEFLVKLF